MMTKAQQQALRLLWGRMRRQDIACLFGLSEDDLLRQARSMGLDRSKPKHEWSTREEQTAWLMRMRGQSYAEIARVLRISENAVRRKVYELRQREKAS